MTKTVEQAVEETGGDANSIVGCSELANARLYYANGRYAWVSPNHVGDEENNVICARHVYDDFAAKWKAAKKNPKVAGHQAMYSQIQEDAENFLASQGKEWVNGLPPVNEWVEVTDDFYFCGSYESIKICRGDKVRCIGYVDYGHGTVAVFADETNKGCGSIIKQCYKPIPSDRDKAIEEMAEIIGQPGDDGYVITPYLADQIAATLYLKGYRKQMSRKEARAALAKLLEDERGYTYEELLDAFGWERD